MPELAVGSSADSFFELVANRGCAGKLALSSGFCQDLVGHFAASFVFLNFVGRTMDKFAMGSGTNVILEIVAEIQRPYFVLVLVLAKLSIANAPDKIATYAVFFVALSVRL